MRPMRHDRGHARPVQCRPVSGALHCRWPRRTSRRTRPALPKKGTPSSLKGCLRGAALEATDVGDGGFLDAAVERPDLPPDRQEGSAERDEAEARRPARRGARHVEVGPPAAGRIRSERRRDAHHHRRAHRGTCRRGARPRPANRCRSWRSRASKAPGPAAAAECRRLASLRLLRSAQPRLPSSPCCCSRRSRIPSGARSRRAARGRARRHALPPRRSVAARSPGAGVDLAAAGRSGARRISAPCSSNDEIVDTEIVPDIAAAMAPSPRSTPASSCFRRAIPRGSTSSGSARQRHQASARRARHLSATARGAAPALRPRGGDDAAAGAAARPARRRRGDRRRRHDAAARQADAVHARLSRSTPTRRATGLEWVVQGKPLRVTSGPLSAGKTPIPRDGYVLSFGGPRPPPPLQSLRTGTRVELDTRLHGGRRRR